MSDRRPPRTRRERALARVRARMARQGSPRLQMLALLTVTGGAGFAASYALLHLGVRSMAVRYPVAVLFAYACFLLVLRLWLGTMMRRERRRDRSRSDWDLDVDVFDVVPGRSGGGGGGGSGPRGFGGGGGFSGGGAGGSWGGPAAPAPIPAAAPMGPPAGAPRMQGLTGGGASSRGSGGGFKLGLPSVDLDDDSGVLIALILLVVAAVALVMAAGYIVIIAPALLAELVVDGIVVAGLYRRVREIDDARWLRTAVRKTWIPALVVALLLGGVGYGVQRALPEARSVGDVWRAAPSSERGDAVTAP